MPPLHHLHDPLALIVVGVAVYRTTRLLTADELLRRPRTAVEAWAAGTATRRAHPAIGTLAGCAWCLSVWVAVGWLLLLMFAPLLVTLLLAAPLAWSALAGLLSSWE